MKEEKKTKKRVTTKATKTPKVLEQIVKRAKGKQVKVAASDKETRDKAFKEQMDG